MQDPTHSLTVVFLPFVQIDLQQDVGGFADREKDDRQDNGRDDRDQRSRLDRGQDGYRRYPGEVKVFDVLHRVGFKFQVSLMSQVSGQWF